MLLDDIKSLYERICLQNSAPESADLVEFVILRKQFCHCFSVRKAEQLMIISQLTDRVKLGRENFDPSVFISTAGTAFQDHHKVALAMRKLSDATDSLGLPSKHSPLRKALLATDIGQIRQSLYVMWCMLALQNDDHLRRDPPQIQPGFNPNTAQA